MTTKHPSGRQIELGAVVHTQQLQHRPRRPRDYRAEGQALGALAQMLANPPRDILQRLVEAARELCQSGSAGISIIEDHIGEKIFRWHALTGPLASYKRGTTPRDFSPCGTVIDRNATQLMLLPERHFLYLANVKPQIVEVLLVPFAVREQAVGTIWVVSHDDQRRFDGEDARVVGELAKFAAEAYQFASSVAASKIADRRKDEFLAALAHELRSSLSVVGNALQNMPDRARNPEVPEPGEGDLEERQLKAMKRVIAGLLDRSRISFEAIAAAAPELTIGDAHGISSPAISRPRSMPLPRAPRNDKASRGAAVGTVPPATDSGSLLRRMRRGDQRALEELYDGTVDSVYALALAILRSREDAEEVVCDTYARAWRQSDRFDADRATPLGWLMTMCRSRAIDRLRHNRSRGSTRTVALESVCDPINEVVTPEELLSLFQNGSRVQAALAMLGSQRLKLVGLAFFEGLSFPEIAERTALPLGTVKSHIRRAMVELRRNLQLSERPGEGSSLRPSSPLGVVE